jgi:hypothetical protein
MVEFIYEKVIKLAVLFINAPHCHQLRKTFYVIFFRKFELVI